VLDCRKYPPHESEAIQDLDVEYSEIISIYFNWSQEGC